MRKSNCVIQFAKWPVYGNVKTRLAANLGHESARDVHIRLATQVYSNLCRVENADIEIHVDVIGVPDQSLDNGVFDKWERGSLLTLQNGKDLGERMAGALNEGLKSYQKVLIVGSDCPSVDSHYVDSAFAKLDHSPMVIGPAEDGGYVLVGACSPISHVFEGVEWGSAKVLEQTVANAMRLNISLGLLEERWDVDELADYVRWSNLFETAK